MAATSYGDISNFTAAYLAREALKHAEPILVLSKFGLSTQQPANKSDTIKFRRPVPFGATTTPLVEGVTPSPQVMKYEVVTVKLDQFGNVAQLSDKITDMHEAPVVQETAMLMGENAAETVEMITWGAIKGGTTVQYTNGTARTDVNTAIDVNDFRAAVRTLQRNRGKAVTRMLDGSPNYATKPVEGGYIAFGHTDLAHDIRQISSFVPVASYGSRQPLCPEELGSIENVRVILSPLLTPWADGGGAKGSMISTTGTSADVYPLIVVAQDAYGSVALKGASAIEPSVINPGTPSSADPLGQRGYVGWKTYYAAKILNESWLVRIEAGATAL